VSFNGISLDRPARFATDRPDYVAFWMLRHPQDPDCTDCRVFAFNFAWAKYGLIVAQVREMKTAGKSRP
jgi:hypothetical protein